jgi:HSP20 family protein
MRSMVGWDPFADAWAMRREMERALERAMPTGESRIARNWSPVSDVVETADAIVITAELPGVKDSDIEISVHDGVLTISGERRLEEEVSSDRAHRIERSYGGFARRFVLPQGVNEDDISAGVAYGVLKITIPKAAAASEPRQIQVESGHTS